MAATQDGTADRPLPRILVVDDEKGVRQLLRNCFHRLGCDVAEADSGAAALIRLEAEPFDLALIDIRMPPGPDGLEVARRAKRLCPGLHVVIMTGYATIETAIHSLQQGANDFLPKPFRVDQLRVILDKQLELLRDHPHCHPIAQGTSATERLPGLVGSSPAMHNVYQTVRRVAPSGETVLLAGESGTGKELAARAIHFWSPRHRKRFICVNCSLLTDTILENELFGHEPESFTGATARTRGLIEKADGGTLFLDEIGDASPSLQMGLLRVLQEGEVRRVGSADSLRVDVRVIAATNKDLEREAREGHFRRDLYYRLNVVPITMPPLRDRPGDIPLLVAHFLHRLGAADRAFDPDVLRALQRYPWPGNVRELENLVRRLIVLVPDTVIRLDHVPSYYAPSSAACTLAPGSFREAKELFERQYIETLLQRVGGNVAEAARQAGLGRPYLHEKLRKFQIDPESFRHTGHAGPPALA
jgi:DNA-binding NtrC family response regulator